MDPHGPAPRRPRPFCPSMSLAMTTPAPSLFATENPPAVSEGMEAEAALQAIHAWTHTFDALEPYQCDYNAASHMLDVGKLVDDVNKLLK